MTTVPDWRLAYLALLADLRRARAASGLTQAEVANRLGIHMRTLRRWENGEGDPPAGMLFRWAAVVGVQLKSTHGADLPHGEPESWMNAPGESDARFQRRLLVGS